MARDLAPERRPSVRIAVGGDLFQTRAPLERSAEGPAELRRRQGRRIDESTPEVETGRIRRRRGGGSRPGADAPLPRAKSPGQAKARGGWRCGSPRRGPRTRRRYASSRRFPGRRARRRARARREHLVRGGDRLPAERESGCGFARRPEASGRPGAGRPRSARPGGQPAGAEAGPRLAVGAECDLEHASRLAHHQLAREGPRGGQSTRPGRGQVARPRPSPRRRERPTFPLPRASHRYPIRSATNGSLSMVTGALSQSPDEEQEEGLEVRTLEAIEVGEVELVLVAVQRGLLRHDESVPRCGGDDVIAGSVGFPDRDLLPVVVFQVIEPIDEHGRVVAVRIDGEAPRTEQSPRPSARRRAPHRAGRRKTPEGRCRSRSGCTASSGRALPRRRPRRSSRTRGVGVVDARPLAIEEGPRPAVPSWKTLPVSAAVRHAIGDRPTLGAHVFRHQGRIAIESPPNTRLRSSGARGQRQRRAEPAVCAFRFLLLGPEAHAGAGMHPDTFLGGVRRRSASLRSTSRSSRLPRGLGARRVPAVLAIESQCNSRREGRSRRHSPPFRP